MTTFKKGLKGQKVEWPLTQDQIDTLDLSGVVNPKVGSNEYGVPAPPKGAKLKKAMAEIRKCRNAVARDQWPTALFEDYGIDPEVPAPLRSEVGPRRRPSSTKAALLVRMDRVIDVALLWLKHNKGMEQAKINDRYEYSYIPFLETVPSIEEELAKNAHKALHEAFKVKYFFGAIRPETHFKEEMTAYTEGCPPHPEYVAGHGANFGAAYATIVKHFELTDEQKLELFNTMIHAATYRSVAGVHIQAANLAGFALGSAVVNERSYEAEVAELNKDFPEVKFPKAA